MWSRNKFHGAPSDRARWRMLLLILSWPLLLAIFLAALGHHPGLPHNLTQLFWFFGLELLVWGTVFTVGFRISGVTAEQLRVATKRPLRTIAFGVVWFVVIRLVVALVYWIALKWIDPTSFWDTEEKIAAFTDAKNITHHLTASIIAFGLGSILAGVTEELWRAGMLAGIKGLLPGLKSFQLIVLVAVLFSLGHLYQGFWGMTNALMLGILLGSVLVYRNSYGEAAVAHALFDAASFGMGLVTMLNLHGYGPQIIYDASKGNLPAVQHWLAMGGDINATFDAGKDWKNITALESTAGRSNTEMVRFLLEHGANPNLADSRGRTPLIAAAEQNQLPNLKLLIAHGVKIDAQDNRGFTALRSAAEYNHVETARLLLDAGANVNIRDKDGLSPLEAATKWRHADLEKLLQERGGK